MNPKYKVTLGHAVSSENGTHDGKVGDQTGLECRFQEWYNRSKGWTYVIRAKTSADRKKIAEGMIKIVRANVGYSQNASKVFGRTSLYECTKPFGFDAEKYGGAAACDCSSAVAVAVNYAGIKVSKDMYTGNEKEVLMSTGKFKCYAAKKYTQSCENLKLGDILLGSGHTAIVCNVIYPISRLLYITEEGTYGNDALALATRLNELGYLQSYQYKNVEGNGHITLAVCKALLNFQKKKKLQIDGIVGKDTATALGMLWTKDQS